MSKLSEEIIRLRSKNLSYNEIKDILKCAKSTVSYHLGRDQKSKAKSRKYLTRERIATLKREKRIYLQLLAYRYKRMCGCMNCGNKEPIVLQFDHRDPETKITTISQMISDRYPLSVFKEEIRKCDILCANCHLLKTAKDYNYFSHTNRLP